MMFVCDRQLFGVYVLNYYQGCVYSWTSQSLGHFPDLAELSTAVKVRPLTNAIIIIIIIIMMRS